MHAASALRLLHLLPQKYRYREVSAPPWHASATAGKYRYGADAVRISSGGRTAPAPVADGAASDHPIKQAIASDATRMMHTATTAVNQRPWSQLMHEAFEPLQAQNQSCDA